MGVHVFVSDSPEGKKRLEDEFSVSHFVVFASVVGI